MTLKTSILIYLQDEDLTNKFVYDCLDSIRLQTKPADEVIIHSNKEIVASYLIKNPGLNSYQMGKAFGVKTKLKN